MTEDQEEKYLSAGEAATYLSQKWGLPSYKASALKTLRYRWGISPAFTTSNASLWKKSDLDKIPRPTRGRPRGAKKQDNNEGEEGKSSSVTCRPSSYNALSLGASA